MITTVLLDLDDTILDFHKAEKEALKKALQKVGVEPTEKLLARYSEINQAQWKKLELGELTQEEVKISRYRIFFEEYGITASPEETAKCYEQNLTYEHEKVDGALELLQKLHGKYRLYAAEIACESVEKLLKSAVANAETNHGMDVEKLYVAECFVTPGKLKGMKRVMPRARGSAFRIVKRTSHVTVVLKERD